MNPANDEESKSATVTSIVEKQLSEAESSFAGDKVVSDVSATDNRVFAEQSSRLQDKNTEPGVQGTPHGINVLERRLRSHADWLSGAAGGERARFTGDDVKGADLRNRDLRQVIFDNASLLNTDFRQADLSGAEFRNSISLHAARLGRANLNGAVLPHDFKFDLLQNVQDVSREGGNIHKLVFVTCIFGWIFVISTTTETIILNSDVTQIPAIGIAMPIAGICTYGLLIALSMFIYWHLYVSRLWEFLAQLPAVFPDGTPVHDKIFPWLVNYLPRFQNPFMRDQPTGIQFLAQAAIYAVLWFHVPALFLFFWFRYLAAQDPPGTLIQILATTISVNFALWTFIRCKQILSQKTPPRVHLLQGFLALLAPACVMFAISQWIWSDYKLFEPGVIRGDFHGQAISRRPDNWNGMVDQVTGAILSNHRLDGTNFRKSFLVNADFHESILRGCDFQHANCSGADFTSADLEGSDLRSCDMSKAELAGANLVNCKLNNANFTQCKMQGAMFDQRSLDSAALSPEQRKEIILLAD